MNHTNINILPFPLSLRLILVFILAQAFFGTSVTSAEAQDTWTGKCVGVYDGDTITVLHYGRGEKIRLYGIDTPERRQDFGKKAKQYLSNIVFDQIVTIRAVDVDRYGRSIGFVFVEDRNVNRELVKAGFAWVYRKYCLAPFCAEWLDLEAQARKEGIGLWRNPNPIAPWDFRRGRENGSGESSS